ncbi:UNVERIFIED_CONTAM: hypothetical protein Sradi_0018700 [Sesamum radiatum]|uniref:Uncharacterized protein n=1 Tax=Sesamum radiatum TaxID=300843 RepID=A0AAW2WH05_SESRA
MSGKAGSENVLPHVVQMFLPLHINMVWSILGGIGYSASSGSEAASDSFTKESAVGSSVGYSWSFNSIYASRLLRASTASGLLCASTVTDDWFQSTSYMPSHAEAYSSHVDLDLGLDRVAVQTATRSRCLKPRPRVAVSIRDTKSRIQTTTRSRGLKPRLH